MALANEGFDPREGVHDIEMRFSIAQDKKPDREELRVQANMREYIHDVAQRINSQIEDSREKSLALTHLEEALMWTGKAIFK